MSDDPETARQIAELARDARPLLVLDVDEVVLEFVEPLSAFLKREGYELKTETFRLHGNVVEAQTGSLVDQESVRALLFEFFAVQEQWQTAAESALEIVETIARSAEIVMLTAMPHEYRAARRRLLDRLGFSYPVLTTEAAKGPAIRQLRGVMPRPVAFVDDIPHNLTSVQKHVPDAALVHLMAHEGMRAQLPPLDEAINRADDWKHAGDIILAHFGS